jgi:hypothetical protein
MLSPTSAGLVDSLILLVSYLKNYMKTQAKAISQAKKGNFSGLSCNPKDYPKSRYFTSEDREVKKILKSFHF